jgi:hypothetical protein
MASCSEMKSSGNCHSDPVCDQDQLGAIICSCNAWRTSGPTSLKQLSAPNAALLPQVRRRCLPSAV